MKLKELPKYFNNLDEMGKLTQRVLRIEEWIEKEAPTMADYGKLRTDVNRLDLSMKGYKDLEERIQSLTFRVRSLEPGDKAPSFTKRGKSYYSPSGKKYTAKQVRAYHANEYGDRKERPVCSWHETLPNMLERLIKMENHLGIEFKITQKRDYSKKIEVKKHKRKKK